MTRRGGSQCRTLQLGLAGILGAGAALLVACGGNSALIPASNASQLKSDFAAVATEVSGGNCDSGLKAALAQARADLAALPSTVDPRLASALQTGVNTLGKRAASECTPATTTPTNTTTSPPTNTSTNTNTDTTPTNTNTNTNTTQTNTNTDTTPTNTTTDTTPTGTTPRVPTGTTPITVPQTGGGTAAPNGPTGQAGQGSTGGAASGGTPGGIG